MWTTAHQASLSITNSRSLPKLMSIESVMPSSHLILCHPLLLLPPIPPNIRVFSSESALRIRWPKYWSFSFNISPSNEHPGLISFRIDWLDLLAVQSLKRECSYLSNCKLLKASHVFIWGMRKKLSTKIGIKGQQWGRANLLSIYTLIKLNSVKYLTEEGLQLFLSSVFFFFKLFAILICFFF